MTLKYVCMVCNKEVPLKEVCFDKINPNWHTKCRGNILVIKVFVKERINELSCLSSKSKI